MHDLKDAGEGVSKLICLGEVGQSALLNPFCTIIS